MVFVITDLAYGDFSKGVKGNCISKGDFCENTRIRQKLKPAPCLTPRTEKAIMRLYCVSVERERGWLCNVRLTYTMPSFLGRRT